MADAPNISDILDRTGDQIDRPSPLPKGSYIMQVKGLPTYDKSSRKQTPFADFTLQPLQALEDVDEEALNEWGARADGSMKALNDGSIHVRFYLTEDAAFRGVDFCRHCGVDIEEEKITLRQGFERLAGCQVGVFVQHSPLLNSEGVRAEVGRTFSIE